MRTETTAPTQAPQAPATLDGVSIQDCRFTESVGKREPRPPLFSALHDAPGTPWDNVQTGGVVLAVSGGRVIVVVGRKRPDTITWAPGHGILGGFLPGAPQGPRYTGPITPAMWAIINRHWKP